MRSAVVLAAMLTAVFALQIARDLAQGEGVPWGLHVLWLSLLTVLWSGLSLLRRRSGPAIAVLLLATAFALPWGLLVLILRLSGD